MQLTMWWSSNLISFLLFSLPFVSSQYDSRQLSGASVKDYALLGYNFASFNTGDSFSCAHRCLSRDQCKSYNYAMQGPQQGLCELNSVGRDGPKPLEYRPGFVFVEALLRKPVKAKKSCLDHFRAGARTSGVYQLDEDGGDMFAIYCDFHSESGWVWTLVMSQSHANREKMAFRRRPFFEDAPLNEENPNWEVYRLSFNRMNLLKTQSTHWRATCSFPTHGVDYRDYVRADFSYFDPLTFEGAGACKKVEYMDVRGHSCTECTSAWWQRSSQWALHHDSASHLCGFGNTPGEVSSEDNFGFYASPNPSFRCSSSDSDNTNHWFGSRV